MRRVLPTVTAALLAGGLAGCGPSDQQQVRERAQQWIGAAQRGDTQSFCAQLSRSARRQLTQTATARQQPPTCEAGARLLLDPVRRNPGNRLILKRYRQRLDQAQIWVRGDRATLSFPGERIPLRFVREDGEWRALLWGGR